MPPCLNIYSTDKEERQKEKVRVSGALSCQLVQRSSILVGKGWELAPAVLFSHVCCGSQTSVTAILLYLAWQVCSQNELASAVPLYMAKQGILPQMGARMKAPLLEFLLNVVFLNALLNACLHASSKGSPGSQTWHRLAPQSTLASLKCLSSTSVGFI